ncbi:hypothetical protein [Chryseobacterium aquaticum]|uniref:hypothetical protein n=1 Tax=Chryseobacterium aquaticum TaxID=452084 RepID=UPI002FCBD037
MANLETILSWFQTGDNPTEEEFRQTFSSFRHNDTKIPIKDVDGLESSLKLQGDWNQTDNSVADFIKNKPDLSLKADLVEGKVPVSQLPSYVDDVLEFENLTSFPIAGESGKLYLALDSNNLYRWSGSVYIDITQSKQDTLSSVIKRDNYCPKPIYFVEGDEEYTSLGINPNTYSFFWGDMKRSHTGLTNISMGYYSMSSLTTGQSNSAYSVGALFKLTSGSNNTAFGQASLYNLTTGYSNSVFGQGGLYNLTVGLKNTALGTNAGYGLTTGSLNTIIGYKANNSVNFGDKNIFIGANSAQGVTGSNNIMIGVGAGVNGGALNNKLIIHSNHTLSGYSNTSEGNFTTPQLSYLDNALITGDFVENWVKLNSSLQVSKLPAADSSFTKDIVSKPDGTFGWKDPVTVPENRIVPRLKILNFTKDENYYNLTGFIENSDPNDFYSSNPNPLWEVITLGSGGYRLPAINVFGNIYDSMTSASGIGASYFQVYFKIEDQGENKSLWNTNKPIHLVFNGYYNYDINNKVFQTVKRIATGTFKN